MPTVQQPPDVPECRLTGTPASAGLVAAPVVWWDGQGDLAGRRAGGAAGETTGDSTDPAAEALRLEEAFAAALCDLAALLESVVGDEAAEGIVAFQMAMLEDETVTDPVRTRIAAGDGAEAAWRAELDGIIAGYTAEDADSYFRARATDLRDLRDRVAGHLNGGAAVPLPPGHIVLAEDLSPSTFLETDWTGGGIALFRGSTNSHVAILARARGVPLVVGLPRPEPSPEPGVPALLDGTAGTLVIAPVETTRAAFVIAAEAARDKAAAEAAFLPRPAVTADGETVVVMVNVAGPDDLEGLDPAHCDGIGLVRTEFLFDGSDSPPGEEAQVAAYARLVARAAGRPVTLRTLDAGADKPLPWLPRPAESNPFLGVRGVRLSLRHPALLRTQLRAMLRVAAMDGAGPLRIMVPMVTCPAEMTAVRALLDAERADLGPAAGPVALGMMVEVPACALTTADFDADFLSIGSNDLVQYLTACGRDVAGLEAVASGNRRAVAEVLARVARDGAGAGRPVGICGDMAGDPAQLPLVLGAGLRRLSVAPAALARVKAAVARYAKKDGA